MLWSSIKTSLTSDFSGGLTQVLLRSCNDPSTRAQLVHSYSMLTDPDKMGHRFQFLSLLHPSRLAQPEEEKGMVMKKRKDTTPLPVAGFTELGLNWEQTLIPLLLYSNSETVSQCIFTFLYCSVLCVYTEKNKHKQYSKIKRQEMDYVCWAKEVLWSTMFSTKISNHPPWTRSEESHTDNRVPHRLTVSFYVMQIMFLYERSKCKWTVQIKIHSTGRTDA